MFKKAFANRRARKALIFAGAFVLALPVLGSSLAVPSSEAEAGFPRDPAGSSESREIAAVLQVYQPDTSGGSLWDKLVPLSAAGEQNAAALYPGNIRQYQPYLAQEAARAEEVRRLGFIYTDQIPLSRELQEYTFAQCVENGLSYELVLALMWRESRFQVTAVGYNRNGTRDNGVMQINDVNRGWLLSELGITDLMDPRQNIAAGTAMLGRLTAKYGEHNALMAYQYGETGMRRKLRQGVTTNELIEMLYVKRAEFMEMLDSTVEMV
jgi:soluble lytic murein transglycosylase-like protein